MSNIPYYNMTIAGEPIASEENAQICNPFDQTVVGEYPVATTDHLEKAVQAARDAFQLWSRESDATRVAACHAIAKTFEDNAAALSALITKEQGKPLDAGGFGSGFELGGCIGWSMATSAIMLEDKILLNDEGVRAVHKRVPIGVIGSITPWNWPLLIAVWHFIPAIRAGNTVVVKPSPFTPLSTLKAVELINEVLPAGVLNVVTGDSEIGAAMSSHPDIDKIMFTGSTNTGKKVMARAANNVTRCTLELGGNDAAIVLPGSDVEAMAPGLFFGSFINAGQTCGAIKRIYVHRDDYQKACDAMASIAANTKVGDGMLAETDMGPLQNKPQYDKVLRLISEAVEAGAKCLVGGETIGDGFAIKPAILSDCKHGMSIVDDEQFGPVIPIISYDNIDEAIAMANSTEFGLCASVWGSDAKLIEDVSNQLVAGTVYINTHAELHPMVPFGGVKSSGLGIQFGEEGLHSFTNSKIIYERSPA